MNAKIIFSTLISLTCLPVFAQEVRLARVMSVTPIETTIRQSEPRNVCTVNQIPIYREVPVQVLIETPGVTVHTQNAAAPVLGMLLGAAIGNRMFSGDARVAGTFLGAAAGASIAESSSRVTSSQYTYVTQMRRELVDHRYQEECVVNYQTVHRNVITGYNVTYNLNGVTRTVVMNSRPGDYVRVITSTTVEP